MNFKLFNDVISKYYTVYVVYIRYQLRIKYYKPQDIIFIKVYFFHQIKHLTSQIFEYFIYSSVITYNEIHTMSYNKN